MGQGLAFRMALHMVFYCSWTYIVAKQLIGEWLFLRERAESKAKWIGFTWKRPFPYERWEWAKSWRFCERKQVCVYRRRGGRWTTTWRSGVHQVLRVGAASPVGQDWGVPVALCYFTFYPSLLKLWIFPTFIIWLIIWASLGGSVVNNLPAMQEMQEIQFWFLGWEGPWRRKWQPTPVFEPGKSHGQRNVACYSLWGHKESDMTEHACMHGHHFYFTLPSLWKKPSSFRATIWRTSGQTGLW